MSHAPAIHDGAAPLRFKHMKHHNKLKDQPKPRRPRVDGRLKAAPDVIGAKFGIYAARDKSQRSGF